PVPHTGTGRRSTADRSGTGAFTCPRRQVQRLLLYWRQENLRSSVQLYACRRSESFIYLRKQLFNQLPVTVTSRKKEKGVCSVVINRIPSFCFRTRTSPRASVTASGRIRPPRARSGRR